MFFYRSRYSLLGLVRACYTNYSEARQVKKVIFLSFFVFFLNFFIFLAFFPLRRFTAPPPEGEAMPSPPLRGTSPRGGGLKGKKSLRLIQPEGFECLCFKLLAFSFQLRRRRFTYSSSTSCRRRRGPSHKPCWSSPIRCRTKRRLSRTSCQERYRP